MARAENRVPEATGETFPALHATARRAGPRLQHATVHAGRGLESGVRARLVHRALHFLEGPRHGERRTVHKLLTEVAAERVRSAGDAAEGGEPPVMRIEFGARDRPAAEFTVGERERRAAPEIAQPAERVAAENLPLSAEAKLRQRAGEVRLGRRKLSRLAVPDFAIDAVVKRTDRIRLGLTGEGGRGDRAIDFKERDPARVAGIEQRREHTQPGGTAADHRKLRGSAGTAHSVGRAAARSG